MHYYCYAKALLVGEMSNKVLVSVLKRSPVLGLEKSQISNGSTPDDRLVDTFIQEVYPDLPATTWIVT